MDIQTYIKPENWKIGDDLVEDRVLSKEEAHDRGLLHLSTHLLIINGKGEILCRKRADNDFRYAGLWTTTIGTHVELGSDYKKLWENFCRVVWGWNGLENSRQRMNGKMR